MCTNQMLVAGPVNIGWGSDAEPGAKPITTFIETLEKGGRWYSLISLVYLESRNRSFPLRQRWRLVYQIMCGARRKLSSLWPSGTVAQAICVARRLLPQADRTSLGIELRVHSSAR